MYDLRTLGLVVGVLVVLGTATAVAYILRRRATGGLDPAILETFWVRIRAWWLLCSVLAGAFLFGKTATVVLFGLISFWALREFITLTPTRPGDHRTLFLVFFLCTPLQFVLVGMEGRWVFNPHSPRYLGTSAYDLYSMLIPVYAFLLIPAQIAMSGDHKRFLERSAKIMAGLLVCVYCLSYAPALLTLRLPPIEVRQVSQRLPNTQTGASEEGPATSGEARGTTQQVDTHPSSLDPNPSAWDPGSGFRLLFFFVLMVQLSDVFHYAWAQLPSKHVMVPTINPNKTWEGLLGGTATAALLGTALCWATPFPYWLAAGMSAVIALMGFAGSLTMSAIKRDRGVKDYGTLVVGHGGVLDRIDSLCFAAPVFFHFTRYFLIGTGAMT